MEKQERKVYDGIRYPAIDELAGSADSKYKLVVAVAHRAQEIMEDGKTFLANDDRFNKKPIGVALEEIQKERIAIK